MKPIPEELIPALKRELEEAIICVNYHYQSGYERHVNLQKPESIFLNFLKKKVTLVPQNILYKIKKRDFTLTMTEDNFIVKVHFIDLHLSYWQELSQWIDLLNKAQSLIDYEELHERSKTMDKFYQQTEKIINEIKDFKIN